MAAESRRTPIVLSERLLAEAYRFDFFQAVRLLERADWERSQRDAQPRRQAVGRPSLPQEELVRFKAAATQAFPASAIVKVEPARGVEGQAPDARPLEMEISFLGLTGPQGVLPQHYTTELLLRLQNNDTALADFFDLFNHRIASLFYRAWEKYRVWVAFQRSRLFQDGDDQGTRYLSSLVGLGEEHLRRRLAVDDDALVFYSGHYSHFPRCAISLELLLADYFAVAVRVEQFQGQWLRLGPLDQSRMPSRQRPAGLNCQLGENVIVGEQVWDVKSKFRVQLGALSYSAFQRFMPCGDGFRPLSDLIRMYAGPELDFELQVLLLAAEVPVCRLGGDEPTASRLGWNTWSRSVAFDHDADDAVFRVEALYSGDVV
jgi:type VI secretion system protein ImpH